jgi:hypothetical protein
MAASAPSAAPGLPELDPDAYFKGKMGGTFGKNVTEILPAYKRVAVAGFRVAFVTKDSATAQVRSSSFLGRDTSGARMTVNAALDGVDAATMQAVADKAYANFLEQLRLAGREVVPQEELKEFLSGVQATPTSVDKPFTKEFGAQTLQLFAPTGMPLWFIHIEGPWSDRGAYILRRYCPPTSNSALVICPSEQTRTASISTSNTFLLSITACCRRFELRRRFAAAWRHGSRPGASTGFAFLHRSSAPAPACP